MYGLPGQPGVVGWTLLALGAAAAAAASPALWRWSRRELRDTAAGGAVAATLAVTLAAMPLVLWRVVEDIRLTSRLSDEEAATLGATMNGLEPGVFERLRAAIPPDDSYAVRAGPRLTASARVALGPWASYALLPRVQVDDAGTADWLVAWGVRTPPDDAVRITVRGDTAYLLRLRR